MQLWKEECVRTRIHNGSSVQTENSIIRVTARHHEARRVMPSSYPSDRIFNQHLTTIKVSYSVGVWVYDLELALILGYRYDPKFSTDRSGQTVQTQIRLPF